VTAVRQGRPGSANAYGRAEWAGAFGDLGTLVPFVTAYIAVVGMDPFGILFAFGIAMVACGAIYRTPFPVQPMKAIGAVAAMQTVQSVAVTPEAVACASLATGVIWLVLGWTGTAGRVARLVPPTVVAGIVLGLGFGFMLQGLGMVRTDLLLACVAAGLVVTLTVFPRVPAMFGLVVLGFVVGGYRHPELLEQLLNSRVEFRWPSAASLAAIDSQAIVVGVLLLALPQVPLTLGNAVIAVTAENNRLFPDRPVSEDKVAVSTGLVNLLGGVTGGVPMCHGAGGMAGHVAFGARTGGAVVILGALLLAIAFFFADAVVVLFRLLPEGVLGVILFVTGLHLASGTANLPADRATRVIVLATAAIAVVNVAAAFVAGLLFHHLRARLRP
jgi:MFS superfamily sulfate permease-like transporter